jgi:hypothetical protein
VAVRGKNETANFGSSDIGHLNMSNLQILHCNMLLLARDQPDLTSFHSSPVEGPGGETPCLLVGKEELKN